MVHELVKRKDRLTERRDDGKEQNFLKIPENTKSVVLFLQTLYRFFLYMAYLKYSNFSRKTRGDILSREYRHFQSRLDLSYTASGHTCTIFET
jgi:hypothetical protein